MTTKRPYRLATKKISDLHIEDTFREDEGDLATLTSSIKEKGLLQPITISTDDKVLAGRRRIKASLEAGLTEIPVLIRDTEDELDEREIELFENIHRKDYIWQERDKLTAHIHELMVQKHGDQWSQRKTADLLGKSRASVTHSVEMVKAMEVIPELGDAKTADAARRQYKRLIEEAAVQEALEEAQTKQQRKAVIWANDHYKIGDTLDQIRKVNAGTQHFAEVDPPYAIDLKKYREQTGSSDSVKSYNEIDREDYPKFLRVLAEDVYRVLYDDAFCVWWFGPLWYAVVYQTLTDVGFKVDNIPAIWYKINTPAQTANPDTYLNRGYEPFFICRKGSPVLRWRGRSNVYVCPSERGSERIHPTQRPISLMIEILRTFAYPEARIIIPFLGSGNTIIAAYKEGMIGHGWDLSDKYKAGFLRNVVKEFPDIKQ